jgi:two-component system sensor histidine kinase MtrB
MAARVTPSPLAGAALALIGGGVTPADLAARFRASKAVVEEAAARHLLDELRDLGLVRAVPGDGATKSFLTPLWDRLLGQSFSAHREHVDLLAEIEEMRTDLLSTIAHELRTPLTAVRTSVGLLLDPAVEPNADQRRTLLETIDRNATRMQRVVGDILDLARFRSGRVQLQLRRFDARELAASAIASIRPLTEARAQRLVLVAPEESVPVFGDFRRLEQALVNLLSNAQRYSPEGAPITIAVTAREPNVSWSVTDIGRGIEPRDKARLFERFFVARGDSREPAAGIGLGLPITLLIVEAHDGRIDVDSEPGRGSTFTVVVPASGPREPQSE